MDTPTVTPDSQTGAMEIDHQGVIVFADANAYELLGPDLVGRHVDDLAPAGHAQHRAAFAVSPSARSMVGRVVNATRTDGRVTAVHIGLLPISRGRIAVAVRPSEPRLGARSEATRSAQAIIDDLKRIQDDLSVLSEAGQVLQYLDLVESQMPVLFAIGGSTGWVRVSSRLAHTLGWDRDAMSQQPYEELIHPDDLAHTADVVSRAMEKRRPGRVDNRYRVFGTDRWRALRWTWEPPGPTGLTLAVAENLGEAEG